MQRVASHFSSVAFEKSLSGLEKAEIPRQLMVDQDVCLARAMEAQELSSLLPWAHNERSDHVKVEYFSPYYLASIIRKRSAASQDEPGKYQLKSYEFSLLPLASQDNKNLPPIHMSIENSRSLGSSVFSQ